MNEEDNGGLGAAALFALGLGYLGMHFLFPGASPAAMVLSMLKSPGAAAAAVGTMMKAPGAGPAHLPRGIPGEPPAIL